MWLITGAEVMVILSPLGERLANQLLQANDQNLCIGGSRVYWHDEILALVT